MAQLYGCDISQFQGDINWDQLNADSNFVIIRSSYGTVTDPTFAHNQSEARRVRASAGPLGVGYYYFAYPTLLDPQTSADYFVDSVGGLEEEECLFLDLEGNVGPNPVGWSLDWLRRVEQRTSVKPLMYLNQSEVSGYDWSPVISGGYGLWLAQYDGDKTGGTVVTPWPVVAFKQWTDKDVVAGISGPVDGDTFFGDFNAFYAYGYQPAPPAPEPQPAPPVEPTTPPPVPPSSAPIEIPVQVVTPPVESAPDSSPVVTPPPSVVPPVSPSVSSAPSVPSVWSLFWNSVLGRAFLSVFATLLTPLIMYLQNFHTSSATLATAIVAAVGILLTTRDLLNNRLPNLPKL